MELARSSNGGRPGNCTRVLYTTEDRVAHMDAKLTAEELDWLKQLDTVSPTKPVLPGPISATLVERGLAIELVEGGLQLTTLGRERLSEREGSKNPGSAA